MLKREEYIKRIDYTLAWLLTEIKLRGYQNLYDSNVISEDFMAGLLNIIFGYQLENLNHINPGHTAVDLGDLATGICFQVTAEKKPSKIRNTIDKFIAAGLYEEYSQLYFFILQESYKSSSDFDTKGHFIFDKKKHILDFEYLAKKIRGLETEKLEEIVKFLDKEISVPFTKTENLEENLPAQPLPATIVYASVNPTDLYTRSPELPDVHFAIFFKVENKSLTRLENVRLGVITWILGSNEERISERLLENIEVIKPIGFRYPCKLVHYSCESSKTDTLTIGPYEIVRTKDFGKIAIPESEIGYEWQAALYLIREGFLPLWYQLTCGITNSRQFFTTENRPNNIKFNLVHNSLPIVTWK